MIDYFFEASRGHISPPNWGKLGADHFYVITTPTIVLWEAQHEDCNI